MLTDIKAPPQTLILIKEDNQGTIAVANNLISHNRTKHIDIKLHYVRDALEDNISDLIYCPTKEITAYIYVTEFAKRGLIHTSDLVTL